MYGQREIAVESDHKLLEAILKKPIYQAPLRLQKMILRLKPYSVNIKNIPGYHLVLADTFSRYVQLQRVVLSGWLQTKVEASVETRPYWNYRDEISCYKGLMFKGDRIIVPHTLQPEILHCIHSAHLGIVQSAGQECSVLARYP